MLVSVVYAVYGICRQQKLKKMKASVVPTGTPEIMAYNINMGVNKARFRVVGPLVQLLIVGTLFGKSIFECLWKECGNGPSKKLWRNG